MIRSSTLVSVLFGVGLLLGFLRDLFIVRVIGTGGSTDAFYIAVFLPDALRMMVAAGVIAAAFLPMWAASEQDERRRLAASTTLGLIGLASLIAIALWLAAPMIVPLIGPGLSQTARTIAIASFRCFVWAIPPLALYGLLAAIHQGGNRFFWPAAGSAIYNGVAIGYLAVAGHETSIPGLSLANVLATVLMAATLMPGAWQCDWRPFHAGARRHDFYRLAVRLAPLLASALAGNAAVLLERSLASLFGEGAVTFVNLARKIVTMPISTVNSLSQVALPRFVNALHLGSRAELQRQLWLCLGLATLLTWPMTVTLMIWAPPLGRLMLSSADPAQHRMLAGLVAAFALSVVPASWNILLARGYYAQDDMVTPTRIEIFGMLVHLGSLALLFRVLGLWSVPAAVLAGVATTCALLVLKSTARPSHRHAVRSVAILIALTGLAYLVAPWIGTSDVTWRQLAAATGSFGLLTAAGAAVLWSWNAKETPGARVLPIRATELR